MGFKGVNSAIARLEAMRKEAKAIMVDEIDKAVHGSQKAMQLDIATPSQGREYDTTFYIDKNKKLRKGVARTPHTASVPGQAPNTDTGKLIANIAASTAPDQMYGKVFVNDNLVPYANYLENGTPHMLPRPFFIKHARPAEMRMKKNLRKRLINLARKFNKK